MKEKKVIRMDLETQTRTLMGQKIEHTFFFHDGGIYSNSMFVWKGVAIVPRNTFLFILY